jgi:hypothetical protein
VLLTDVVLGDKVVVVAGIAAVDCPERVCVD